ncbi:hypothetical protein K440DRAFT_152934 [Wilcoxina mikolae CBS 423.85]|nr:hypothetical protein K440DRAFT_152934 [Wilcoxina mikolae CBS 423.85]
MVPSPLLLTLPDELLLQVVSFLEPTSVIQLHHTCSRLRSLTRSNSTLWRSFCIDQAYIDSNPNNCPQWNRSEELDLVIDTWPHQEVDWYSEYQFRHAPLKMKWLSSPEEEVKGLTSISTRNTHKHLLISPLDDGAINIWSSTSTEPLSRSRPGILTTPPPPASRKSRIIELGDTIVASSQLDRVYVAVDSTLIELSLTTLQTISSTKFPFSISTLSSQVVLPHPLTVGTTLTLHLYDPRVGMSSGTPSAALPPLPFPENYGHHAPLFQPSPLAILHHPNNHLYVAGRFPSILCYDRAMWPKLQSTIHSGGNLCTLAADGVDGLLAGGTYNGRGSLESYYLSSTAKVRQRNRQSVAWGKILSVAKQGTRVVSCDSEGTISWFERDCRYVVRREDIFDPDARANTGILWDGRPYDGSGPVRKVVVMNGGGDGLGVWLGDRVGVLSPGLEDEEEELVMEDATGAS